MATTCPHCGMQIDSEEHVFTRDELKKMSLEDFRKNHDVIMKQVSEGKITGGGVRRNGDIILSGPVRM